MSGCIAREIERAAPDVKPSSIKSTPVDGIYEVRYGAQVLYLSEDGRYVFRGSLFDLEQRRDLTEATLKRARMEILEKVDEREMIVFSPKHPEHIITVFTDIDCTYCRMLHSQISQYLQEGIEVRYMAFPRAGVDSPSFEKTVDVWCADDPAAALTRAKRGQPVAHRTCDNSVKNQMALGQRLGVSGTPAIVLENGEMIPGYQSPKALSAMLGTGGDTGNAIAEQ